MPEGTCMRRGPHILPGEIAAASIPSLGIVRNYDDLHRILRQRADHLRLTRANLDEIAGLPSGYAGKLLGKAKVKKPGAMSLAALLGSLGLALVAIEDPDAMARMAPRHERAR